MKIDGNMYRRLLIAAKSPETNIWLGDDEGHLVQKEAGLRDTSLMAGDDTVEFGLGDTTYPIHLTADAQYTEEQIKAGPSCSRPPPNIAPSATDNSEFR